MCFLLHLLLLRLFPIYLSFFSLLKSCLAKTASLSLGAEALRCGRRGRRSWRGGPRVLLLLAPLLLLRGGWFIFLWQRRRRLFRP